jgi:folate-binding protein YgfZ
MATDASPFLDLPGAVDAVRLSPASPDAGVPAHYGNPIVEQRALESGRAIVDLSNRSVLSIAGPDRLTWLNSMSSQLLTSLAPGESSETLLLDPNGHIEHAVHVIDDGETLWLIVERDDADATLEFLQNMRFMLRVEPLDRTAEFAVIGGMAPSGTAPSAGRVASTAPSAGRVASVRSEHAYRDHHPALGLAALTWHDPWPHVVPGGHQYSTGEHPGVSYAWTETLIPRAELPALAARVASRELEAAGTLAAEALRIAAWRPRLATDVDDRTIPHELDWLRTAVHLNKGCYRGQETVAKVHNLGHPPRRLVMLHLDGSDAALPAPGAEVSVDKAGERVVVGRVTSSGIHHELGPVALAVIKRSTDAVATLHVDADGTDVAATQQVIVPPDAGAEANVPRIPRLGAVSR